MRECEFCKEGNTPFLFDDTVATFSCVNTEASSDLCISGMILGGESLLEVNLFADTMHLGGFKHKINFCPMCGRKLEKG
jgi:hypothetical protein